MEENKNPDWLILSIFHVIFFFFLLGIPALYFSLKARRQYAENRIVEARKTAKISKIINIVGIFIGSLAVVLATAIVIIIIDFE